MVSQRHGGLGSRQSSGSYGHGSLAHRRLTVGGDMLTSAREAGSAINVLLRVFQPHNNTTELQPHFVTVVDVRAPSLKQLCPLRRPFKLV